jgi:hypothetical protein
MRPHLVPSPADDESDLFRNRLDSLIDMRHEFVRKRSLDRTYRGVVLGR